ncbi:MAG: hypothetical protein R3F50_09745 [Gammaproteobacteria bacterium]|jgi:hypothetical protein
MYKRLIQTAIILLLPTLALASSPEADRLAALLEQASLDLAQNARNLSGAGGIAHNSQQLAAKARQLQDMIRRGRSSAYVRVRFTDVTRYYQRLEEAVARLNARSGGQQVQSDFARLALSFEQLRYQFVGDSYYTGFQSAPAILVIPQIRTGNRYVRNPDLGLSERPRHGQSHSERRLGEYRHQAPVLNRRDGRLDGTVHRSPVLERRYRNEHLGAGRPDRAGSAVDRRLEANQGYYRLGQ